MTKINREEYEILKGLDDKWKWIARDNDTILWVYENEPRKYGFCKRVDSDLFKFIQWGDERPFNIAELIEEYEKEREETEMKKDIEWVKNKIDLEVIRRIGREYPHFYVNVGLKMALDFLKQLDEPETLSSDWISDNGEYAYYMTPKGTYSSAKAVIDPNKLENTLVPKQELPVIPHFVADYLDFAKSDVPLMRVMELANTRNEWSKWEKEYDWISANDETFARAWLDGFTVADKEEEQKYYALIKGHEKIGSDDKYWNYCITDESLDIGDNKVHADVLAEYVLSATKDEWENLGINDDNADFVKVEGL